VTDPDTELDDAPDADPSPKALPGETAPADEGLDDREYSLIEHLAELRDRLMRAAIGVFAISLLCFAVSEDILELVKQPMIRGVEMVTGAQAKFIVISPAEYFIAQLKAAVVAGIFLSMPWSLYQIWLFVAPGLYAKEKRYAVGFIWAGTFFFLAGGVFAYELVFPGMFKFFVENTMKAGVEMNLSVAEHFSFTLKLLLAFGLVFQAPVVVFVLSMAGIVNPKTLGKYRGVVVVVGFVAGAVLTPPDVLSQVLLALPLVVLFELGLLAAKIAIAWRERRDRRAGVPTP
jgi:sec-independent protein translocase protein TatC